MRGAVHSTRPTPLAAAVAVALILSTGMAFAETATDAEAARVKELDAVRVIANPEDPQSSTGSAYVLTPRELDKFERGNVNNVLRSVPGVYTREESGEGVFPRISIRASSSGRSDRISVLEDGVPAAMAPYANTSAYYFPNIGRMSSVEVLKGPEILLHGPHTTSGVVNLLSTPIPDSAQGQLKAELGSFDTRKLHAYYGTTAGQWGFLLETYQNRGDGFHNIDRSDLGAGHDINEYVGKVRWSSAPDARFSQQVDLKLHYDEETARVSYLGLTDADFRADPDRRYGLSELERMDRGRKSASLQHQIGFTDSTWLTTTAYLVDTYRYYDRLNQVNGVNLGGITDIVNTGGANAALLQGILQGTANTTHPNGVRYGHNHQAFVSKGLKVELEHGFATGDVQHTLTTGVRYHEDTTKNVDKGRSNSYYAQVNGDLVYLRTDFVTPQRGDADAWSAWLADRIEVGNWSLLPILRHERIRSRANLATDATPAQIAARNSNSIDKTTAGFGANYALNANWTLLGGVHQGFAPPGNGSAEGTKGEESTNFEAGVRYRNGSFGMDAIGFLSDYDNAMRTCLVANPCSGGVVDGTEQTGSKEVYGLELGAFATLYDNGAIRVPLRLAYTWTDGEYTRDSDTGSVLKGDVIEYTPKHIGQLQLGVEGEGGWNAYAALNYSDGAYTTNTAGRPGVDDTYQRTQSLFTVDVAAAYPLSSTAEVYARIDNVLDERRITHRGADGARGNAPRGYAVGLRLKF
ncbi:TonB-dependent receptor [Luteimonas aestuarii]|uniref:TonB-dependent receptor n=1 Tax=Luteimonas aestuarii TaxID=453837 RepID=A0A4R5TL23_9GAMM|nr:TonB-dependent receptor [Luteimonas aestuarii]TDK23236.1 TonB-dependent receptor [Luteimonas aestuarii]